MYKANKFPFRKTAHDPKNFSVGLSANFAVAPEKELKVVTIC